MGRIWQNMVEQFSAACGMYAESFDLHAKRHLKKAISWEVPS